MLVDGLFQFVSTHALGTNSPMLLTVRQYVYFMTLILITTVLSLLNPLVSGVLWFFFHRFFIPFKGRAFARVWALFPVLFIILGMTWAIPLLCFVMVRKEQALSLPCLIDDGISYIMTITNEMHFASVDLSLGNNSKSLGQEISDWFDAFVYGEMDLFSPSVYAKYLRDNSLNASVDHIGVDNLMDLDDMVRNETNRVSRTRILMFFGIFFIAFQMQASVFGVILGTSLIVFSAANDVNVKYLMGSGKKATMKNGTYLLEKKIFGFTIDSFIGTVFNGVMHAPYHGAGNCVLRYEKSIHHPYYVSITSDVVTWGGPPQYQEVKEEDEVFMNVETLDSRTTYYLGHFLVSNTGIRGFTWASRTVPGESGSPLFKQDSDGCLHLVGMAGRWQRSCEDDAPIVEYFVYPDTIEMVADANISYENQGRLRKIVLHPGAGKTHHQIPALCRQHISEMRSKGKKPRIVISGPTRVVSLEDYEALRNQFGSNNVGLNIKGHNEKVRRNAVMQVGAHHSIWSMIHKKQSTVYNPTLMIIDEAHFNSFGTKVLMNWAKSKSQIDDGFNVVLMSATIDGECDKRSNYPIDDIKIKYEDIDNLAFDHATEGKRVLVFVPGHDGKNGAVARAKSMNIRISESGQTFKSLVLTSKTYSPSTIMEMSADDVNIIYSTNISECGMNFNPPIDVVIDSSRQFDYFYEDGITFGKEVIINEENMVQRRGRTGRVKPGIYYYVDKPDANNGITANKRDADEVTMGREWNESVNLFTDYQLTDAQVEIVNEQGIPPRLAHMLYSSDGTRLNKVQLSYKLKDWTIGNKIYSGCGIKDCLCRGTYAWFDERCHDQLVALKTGNNVMMPNPNVF